MNSLVFSLAAVVDSDEHDKTTDHSPERHRNHVISQDAHPASRDGLCVLEIGSFPIAGMCTFWTNMCIIIMGCHIMYVRTGCNSQTNQEQRPAGV